MTQEELIKEIRQLPPEESEKATLPVFTPTEFLAKLRSQQA
jgi:hypothetical protein